MRLKLGLAAVGVLLATGIAHADVQLSPMAKIADGSIQAVDHFMAIQYCDNHKMRLPTAREWAIHSQSLGAKGIRETRYADVPRSDQRVITERDRMIGEGYYPTYRLNSTKQIVVDFYFNEAGYRRPTGPQGDYFFWASSVVPSLPNYAYGFNGPNGRIYISDRSTRYSNSAHCLVERR